MDEYNNSDKGSDASDISNEHIMEWINSPGKNVDNILNLIEPERRSEFIHTIQIQFPGINWDRLLPCVINQILGLYVLMFATDAKESNKLVLDKLAQLKDIAHSIDTLFTKYEKQPISGKYMDDQLISFIKQIGHISHEIDWEIKQYHLFIHRTTYDEKKKFDEYYSSLRKSSTYSGEFRAFLERMQKSLDVLMNVSYLEPELEFLKQE